jgi:hypothetical protein
MNGSRYELNRKNPVWILIAGLLKHVATDTLQIFFFNHSFAGGKRQNSPVAVNNYLDAWTDPHQGARFSCRIRSLSGTVCTTTCAPSSLSFGRPCCNTQRGGTQSTKECVMKEESSGSSLDWPPGCV